MNDVENWLQPVQMDLNRELIRNPISTFFGRVKGTSMKDAGVSDGDLLIIDKSLEWRKGAMAVCFFDGGFTLKYIEVDKDGIFLVPANPDFEPIRVKEDDYFTIWGIVVHIIKKV